MIYTIFLGGFQIKTFIGKMPNISERKKLHWHYHEVLKLIIDEALEYRLFNMAKECEEIDEEIELLE